MKDKSPGVPNIAGLANIKKAAQRRLGGVTSRVDPFNPKGKGSRYRNEASIEDTGGKVPPAGVNKEYQQAQEGRQTSRVTGPGNNSRMPKNLQDAAKRRLQKAK